MNPRRFILLCLFAMQLANLFSQKIGYSYDDNGNRLSRTLVVEKLQPNSVNFPVYNPKDLKSMEFSKGSSKSKVESDLTMQEDIKSESDELKMVVYPNPNKGIIKIDIANMPINSANELRLYDLSGNEIVLKRNIENYTEIDITNYKDGIYILRVRINEKIFDWKVIKNLPH